MLGLLRARIGEFRPVGIVRGEGSCMPGEERSGPRRYGGLEIGRFCWLERGGSAILRAWREKDKEEEIEGALVEIGDKE